MFATTITACRLFQLTTRLRLTNSLRSHVMHHCLAGRERVDQRPGRSQPIGSKPLRHRRRTSIGPLLAHRDPPPPLDLTHENQTGALLHRDQYRKALTVQWMKRMSDYQ